MYWTIWSSASDYIVPTIRHDIRDLVSSIISISKDIQFRSKMSNNYRAASKKNQTSLPPCTLVISASKPNNPISSVKAKLKPSSGFKQHSVRVICIYLTKFQGHSQGHPLHASFGMQIQPGFCCFLFFYLNHSNWMECWNWKQQIKPKKQHHNPCNLHKDCILCRSGRSSSHAATERLTKKNLSRMSISCSMGRRPFWRQACAFYPHTQSCILFVHHGSSLLFCFGEIVDLFTLTDYCPALPMALKERPFKEGRESTRGNRVRVGERERKGSTKHHSIE